MPRVLVNGSFDILHRGHLRMLEHAWNLSRFPMEGSKGSMVIVLIDSDRRIKELKGPERPINNQEDRRYMLESLRFVSLVKIFDSDYDLASMIEGYEPDIMVKGSDWRGKLIIGGEHCKSILYYDFVDGYSTTKTIETVVARRQLYG
jgi:rfaE bifunctional protein nucleotidyltransferase chain/domain